MSPENRMLITDLLALNQDYQAGCLSEPLLDFFARPSKGFRSNLVEIGFSILSEGKTSAGLDQLKEQQKFNIELIGEILEAIHAGSLIVDDIQDGSKFRRGAPALHEIYGAPLALNAGNWLYFWALNKVSALKLQSSFRGLILEQVNRTLLFAHSGQSLDLGVNMLLLDQTRAASVSMASIEQKSGALVSLAIGLGGMIAKLGSKSEAASDWSLESDQELSSLFELGKKTGMLLQMFDDIGNLTSSNAPEKQYEDLINARPGWIWAVAANTLDNKSFNRFQGAVKNFQVTLAFDQMSTVIHELGLTHLAKFEADRFLEGILDEMDIKFKKSERALIEIKRLLKRIQESYL